MARKIVFAIIPILCSISLFFPVNSASAIVLSQDVVLRNDSGGLPLSQYSTNGNCESGFNGWSIDQYTVSNRNFGVHCIRTKYPSGSQVSISSGDFISVIFRFRYDSSMTPLVHPRYYNQGNRIVQIERLSTSIDILQSGSNSRSIYTDYYEVILNSEVGYKGDIAIPIDVEASGASAGSGQYASLHVLSWSSWYPAKQSVTVNASDVNVNVDQDKVVDAITDSSQRQVDSIKQLESQQHSDAQNQLKATNDLNETIKNQQKKEEDSMNNAQSSASSGADDSQSEVDKSTSNMLGILGDFIGSITSAEATTCEIDFNVGFFDGGRVNLCTGGSKVKTITAVVGTVMLIGLVISLAWAGISEMLRLFGSFQRS